MKKPVNPKLTAKRASSVKSMQSRGEQNRFAKELGISRQLLSLHLKDPEAPKLGDLKGWIDYLAVHGRDGSSPPDIKRRIAEKRLELITEQAEKAKRENAQAAGQLIRDEDNKKAQSFAVQTFSAQIQRMVRDLPSLLVGLTEIEIRQKLQEFEFGVLPTVMQAFQNYE